MKGEQIANLNDLFLLARSRRSVVCKRFASGKPMPAAVMMNQQGHVLLRAFYDGMWLYEKPKKSKGETKNE